MSETRILRAADIQEKAQRHSHPWNPASEIYGAQLAPSTGLTRVGVSMARIAPGKQSFVYHSHQCEEEWIYLLSGRARVTIDGTDHDLGPGDFVGFPTGVAHHLTNPFDEDVVYLMGGERRSVEIADFPRHGKRMVRVGDKITIYPADTGESFGGHEKV